jgi:hypothetical protein
LSSSFFLFALQELRDQIDDLLQERDPSKAQLDVQSSYTGQISDASLPAVSERTVAPVQTVAAVSTEDGIEQGQDGVAADLPAPSTALEEDQNGTAGSDKTAPGPVAEGDVSVEHSEDMDTQTTLQANTDLNASIVDNYIQVPRPTFANIVCCKSSS